MTQEICGLLFLRRVHAGIMRAIQLNGAETHVLTEILLVYYFDTDLTSPWDVLISKVAPKESSYGVASVGVRNEPKFFSTNEHFHSRRGFRV